MLDKQLRYIDIEKSLKHDGIFERDHEGNLIPEMSPEERCIFLEESS